MRRTNRWVAVGIVGAAVVAACVGTLSLSTVEQQTIAVRPNPVSFGSVQILTQSSLPVVIGPATQNDVDRILSIVKGTGGSCAAFALDTPNLPTDVYCPNRSGSGGSTYGGGECVPVEYTFTARFTPTIKGPANCTFTVTYSSTGFTGTGSGSTVPAGSGSGSGSNTYSQTFTLSGIGLAPPVALTVTPLNIPFGDVPQNQDSSTQMLSVTNSGSQAVTVDVTSNNPTVFSVSNAGNEMTADQLLAPDAVATFSVMCTEPNPGANTGLITVTPLEDPALAKTVTVSCNGIVSELSIRPSPASFAGYTLVGAPPPDVMVTIENSGTGMVSVSVELSDDARELSLVDAPSGPVNVIAGGTITLSIHYDAATEFSYGLLGSLLVTEGSATRNVAINGEALLGAVAASPAVADFGPVCAGADVPLPVAVYTTAAGSVRVEDLTQPAAPFNVVSTAPLPTQLLPNHGSMLMLTANVNAPAEGEYTSVIQVDTNIPGAPHLEVPVSALVLPAGLSPTPNVLHFGPGRVGSLTTAQEITISNCTDFDLGIMSAALAGESASDFAIVSTVDLTTETIPQKGKLTIPLVMNPQSEGTKLAQLVVTLSDGSTVTADLDGNGFTGEASDGDSEVDLGTYYTCSTGGGGLSLGPIALALLLARRRRQR